MQPQLITGAQARLHAVRQQRARGIEEKPTVGAPLGIRASFLPSSGIGDWIINHGRPSFLEKLLKIFPMIMH